MESSALDWLSRVGTLAFTLSASAFVVVNVSALAGVLVTRDRALVNRWTGRVLAANLFLAGTGLGIPLLTAMSRLAVSAVLPGVQRLAPAVRSDREVDRGEAPPRQRAGSLTHHAPPRDAAGGTGRRAGQGGQVPGRRSRRRSLRSSRRSRRSLR